MSQGYYFDEEGNPVVDPTGIYRPRDITAKSPTPQAPSSTGDTPDTSHLYRPRYADERPNNFGSRLAASTRQGSVLNIIGMMAGGANAQLAHGYNEAEHRKFMDSIEAEKLLLDQRKIEAEARAREALATERANGGRKTWQDRIMENPDLSEEEKINLLHGRSRQPGATKPKWFMDYSTGNPKKTDESDEDYAARLWQQKQKDDAAHDTRIHPPKADKPKTFTDNQGNVWTLTGNAMTPTTGAEGHSFAKATPGEKPPATPQKYKAGLVAGAQKQAGNAPVSDEALRDAGNAAAQYGRATGQMPDQRTQNGSGPTQTGSKLKPNWRYRINGKEVTTDAGGNIVQ